MTLGGPWQAYSVDEVAGLLGRLPVRWWVAGGWAVDLFVGEPSREHHDLDVAVLRPDQLAVQGYLSGWDLRVAHGGRLTRWAGGRWLAAHEHEVWGRPEPASPWRLELLVEDLDGDQWVYRRNPAVRLPLARLGRRTAAGVPYLRPEVVLLYKAKGPRAHHEHDARVAIPRLSGSGRAWLAAAIAADMPDHPWLPLLTQAGDTRAGDDG
jgi:hypothetical protein